jgi:hypothetical protein
MTTIEKHETLAEAVCCALLDLEAVAKSGLNKRDGYEFRTVDDVMAAVRTPFAKHGVWLKPSFGKPHPVLDADAEKHDPWFLEVDIELELVHAHSAQREKIHGVGRGRMAGSGNVSLPDPRVVGQALSYGMKAMLINAFQLAGGDDSADTAERATAPPPRNERPPADPELEAMRQGTLDIIGTLDEDFKADLAKRLKADGLSVKNGSMEDLHKVAAIIEELAGAEDTEVNERYAGVVVEADTEPDNSEPETADEQVSDPEPEDTPEDTGPSVEELRAELVAAEAKAKPAPEPEERHLAAVPDHEGVDLDGLDDMQFCYWLVSGGKGVNSKQLNGDMTIVTQCVKVTKDLKAGKLQRVGAQIVDANGEVLFDAATIPGGLRAG